MNPWLFSTYQRPIDGKHEGVLSIYLAGQLAGPDEFDAAMARELQEIGSVDSIHFVGYEPQISSLREWFSRPEDVLLPRIRSVLGSSVEALRLFTFDGRAGCHRCHTLGGQAFANEQQLVDDERRWSLLSIFRSSGGEEVAPAGTHYEKTSEKHCDRFLRVANVVERGANVGLIAFWLLPIIWGTSARHVVVDTSGVYSIALTAIHQAMTLGGLSHQPLLWSHRSHQGVNEIPAHIAQDALFVISASTSDGLVERLVGIGAIPSRIVTLFSLAGDQVPERLVLCDLRGDGESGLKPIQNHQAVDCPFCKRQYHLIRIQGDQFSVTPPTINSIEIKGDDVSQKVRPVLAALAGMRAFFAYRRREGDRLCSLGLDVEPLLVTAAHPKSLALQEKVRDKWNSFCRRSETVSLRLVAAASYPKSDMLARSLGSQAQQLLHNQTQVSIVSATGLREIAPQPSTSTIVVSACVDETKELLSISRTLRDIQDGGSIAYLSVVQLIGSKQDSDRLRSNLTYGAQGPGTFSFHTALEIPVECYESDPTWRLELDELQRLVAWADSRDLDVPTSVETRIARLRQAPATGLVDDLFWPNAAGEGLRLRSDFALIEGTLREPVASQADIFATMSVVLTALRLNPDASRRLAHNGYERAVISPSNFDRFNDGVLQASLLRAARAKELAYGASNENLIQQMLAILMHAIPDPSVPERSEALVEFIIALMIGRMTLSRDATMGFADAVVRATETTWPLAAVMGMYLKSKFESIHV